MHAAIREGQWYLYDGAKVPALLLKVQSEADGGYCTIVWKDHAYHAANVPFESLVGCAPPEDAQAVREAFSLSLRERAPDAPMPAFSAVA